MNVMLVCVSERRKEIGIRRALGAKRNDIRRQFLIESLLLSLMGGILGIALGVAASYIISFFAKWEFDISYMAIIIGFGYRRLSASFLVIIRQTKLQNSILLSHFVQIEDPFVSSPLPETHHIFRDFPYFLYPNV